MTETAVDRRSLLRLLRVLSEAATRRPGLLRNLAIFATTIAVGSAAALVYISQEDLIFPWQHVNTYYADFTDAASIAPGQHQEVRVAGVHVGDIGTATVTKGGLARVQLQITDRSIKVYRNATALLQAKTPLNEMYVELNPGTPAAPLLRPGGTIPAAQTQSPVELDQILQHLGPSQQNALRILLEETNLALPNASAYLPADLSAADATIADLRPVAAALATRQAKIRILVSDLTDIAQAVGGNQNRLGQLIDSAQATLDTIAGNDQPLAQTLAELPSTVQTLGDSLSKVQTLTGQVNPVLADLREAAPVLPGALSKLTTTLNELHPLLNQLSPLVAQASPVVANLGGYLTSANPTLTGLEQIAPKLNPVTAYAAYDMPWIKGFFYNTDSLGSLYFGNHQTLPRAEPVAGPASVQGLLAQLGIDYQPPGITTTPPTPGGS